MRQIVLSLLLTLVSGSTALSDMPFSQQLAQAAKALENPDIVYDSSYRSIAYPMGDVPKNVGVCSDVVVRAYRALGIDLQALVHRDMKRHFGVYPRIWGLKRPDKNIDHRRVPNLRKFFQRHGTALPLSKLADDYKPGDIVTWNLKTKGSLPHIGIVTDEVSPKTGHPMIMHNIGRGQVLEDILFRFPITGHYRYGE